VPNFDLRFPHSDISYWADRYQFGTDVNPERTGDFARKHGYLDVDNLFKICNWKSTRRASSAKENTELTVNEITKFSFSTTDEYSKISALTLLKGVMWPTASVILHFCVCESYPILDVRAIWSLGEEKPSYYNYAYWIEYVAKCQEIANTNDISLRYLDKALWQYSRENQDVTS